MDYEKYKNFLNKINNGLKKFSEEDLDELGEGFKEQVRFVKEKIDEESKDNKSS
jgi:hypothetical protein